MVFVICMALDFIKRNLLEEYSLACDGQYTKYNYYCKADKTCQ